MNADRQWDFLAVRPRRNEVDTFNHAMVVKVSILYFACHQKHLGCRVVHQLNTRVKLLRKVSFKLFRTVTAFDSQALMKLTGCLRRFGGKILLSPFDKTGFHGDLPTGNTLFNQLSRVRCHLNNMFRKRIFRSWTFFGGDCYRLNWGKI